MLLGSASASSRQGVREDGLFLTEPSVTDGGRAAKGGQGVSIKNPVPRWG